LLIEIYKNENDFRLEKDPKIGEEYKEYKKVTKKFIPFVY
jgi:protein-S-isoprenylcysteine O-methyltransferase Ste14